MKRLLAVLEPAARPATPASYPMRPLLFLALQIASGQAAAPPAPGGYTVEVWTVEQGLPQNSVTGMGADGEGYLWMATWGGPVRFDGQRFIRMADGITNKQIQTLLVARDGTAWLATLSSGLVRWRNGDIRNFDTADGLSSPAILDLAEDGDGRVWILTAKGLDVMVGDTVRSERAVPPARADLSPQLESGLSGTVLIVLAGDLCRARAEIACRAAPVSPEGARLAIAAEGLDGTTWGAFEDGSVARWYGFDRPRFVRRCGARSCLPRSVPTALMLTREGAAWIGFEDGTLARVQGDSILALGPETGLPRRYVKSLFMDDEGGIWAGTEGAGVAHLRPRRVTMFLDPVRGGNSIGAIAPGADGTVLARSGCGLMVATRGRVPGCVQDPGGAGPFVSIVPAREGGYWIGGWERLIRWAPDRGTLESVDVRGVAADASIRALMEDRSGNLWIGTTSDLLRRSPDGRVERVGEQGDPGVATLSALLEDREGHLWTGSNGGGLRRWTSGAFLSFGADEGLPSRQIQALHQDSAGSLWVGTSDRGLFRMMGDRVIAFDTAVGLPDRTITQILEDRDGNLWVGTNRGIARLERAQIESFSEGRIATLDVVVLDRADGLVDAETSGGGFHPAGLLDGHGRLWFSTVAGLAMVDPATVPLNRTPPRVHITGFREQQDETRPVDAQGMRIAAGTRTFEVEYTAIGFANPARMRFRYRLSGWDERWVQAGQRRAAYFTRMAPGSYTFEVEASNNDGVWSPVPASASVVVLPLWWETTPARVLALVLVVVASGAAGTWAAQRRARRRLEQLEREQELQLERGRIARDLHDDLGARLTRIAMLADGMEDDSLGERVAFAARGAAQAMDEMVWTLDARNDTVASFAAYAARYAEEELHWGGLGCSIHVPMDLPTHAVGADLRRHLFLAFKECINNVLKHAAAREVTVTFAFREGWLEFAVEDDGVGFSPTEVRAGSDGLRNMQDRMEAAGGIAEVASIPGRGTRLRFRVPIAQPTPLRP